jgi:hypothetical protein
VAATAFRSKPPTACGSSRCRALSATRKRCQRSAPRAAETRPPLGPRSNPQPAVHLEDPAVEIIVAQDERRRLGDVGRLGQPAQGIFDTIRSRIFGGTASIMRVSQQPGAIAATRIWWSASSFDQVTFMALTPALAAE